MEPLQTQALAAQTLTDRQAELLRELHRYYATTGEPCHGRYLARRLSLSNTTVRQHLDALYRKGWLYSRRTPIVPVPAATHRQLLRERARDLLHRAVRDGRVIKPSRCARCGCEVEREKLHGHHRDYSQPLEVVWLCRPCHDVADAES